MGVRPSHDPAPLSARQARALLRGAARELAWGLRAADREHAGWLRRASAIPDPDLRRLAVDALVDKRPLVHGAALFWTLPDRRDPGLLRLLVAFQVLANHHDRAGEQVGTTEPADGSVPGSAMRTFGEVLDLARTPRSYRPTPAHRDGGYLAALVTACRDGCAGLPGYDAARPHLLVAADRARALDLEHVADPARRTAELEALADRVFGGAATVPVARPPLTWFELTAGSSSLLTAIATVATAARRDVTAAELAAVGEAYTVVATVSTMLDNYIDHAHDATIGHHNYLEYYGSLEHGVARVGELVGAAMEAVGALRDGERHRVIVAAMVAMYLTSDGARAQDRRWTGAIAERGGTLTALLLPVLAAWRTARREHGA